MPVNKTKKVTSIDLQQTQVNLNKIIAIVLSITLFFTALVALGILPLESSPDIYAIDSIQRIVDSDEQGYRLEIHNKGDRFASNIEVEITFPFQTSTIYKVYVDDETYKQSDGGYKFETNFSKLRAGKTIKITVLIEDEGFEEYDGKTVEPTVNLWCDELGRIDIHRENFKFL
jgi:hypothetical protein